MMVKNSINHTRKQQNYLPDSVKTMVVTITIDYRRNRVVNGTHEEEGLGCISGGLALELGGCGDS